MLRARLYEVEQRRRQDAKQASLAERGEIGWGNQIRSYVLQPYQLVKDLRTQTQSGAPNKVLDGDLDAFLIASLKQH
jgi:peptide chain release factor 2